MTISKLKLFSVVSIVVIIILFITLLLNLKPDYPNVINIHGSVTLKEDAIKQCNENKEVCMERLNKSTVRLVKYNPYLNFLPNSENLGFTMIKWNLETLNGDYSLFMITSFVKEVVLVKGCDGYEIITINPINKEIIKDIDIGFDCLENEGMKISGDAGEEKKQTLSRLEYVSRELSWIEFDDPKRKSDIERDMEQALRKINSPEANEIKSILEGRWYVSRALYNLPLYRLEECIKDTETILNNKTLFNLFFFVPSFDNENKLEHFKQIYDNNNNTKLLYENPSGYNVDDLMSEIRYYDRLREDIGNDLQDCEDNIKDLNNTYNYQYNYFKLRLPIIILGFIMVFISGFIVGKYKSISTFFSSINKRKNKLRSNKGKKLTKEDIKDILRFSSLPTIILAISFAFSQYKELHIITTVTTIISLLLLSIGILIGLISIKYNKLWNKDLKEISYLLILVGLIFFIIIVIEIILIMGLSGIWEGTKIVMNNLTLF